MHIRCCIRFPLPSPPLPPVSSRARALARHGVAHGSGNISPETTPRASTARAFPHCRMFVSLPCMYRAWSRMRASGAPLPAACTPALEQDVLTPLESVEHGAEHWRVPHSARTLLQLFTSLHKLLSAYAFPFSSLSLTPILAQAGHETSLASTPAARPAPLAPAHDPTSDRIRFCAAPPPLPSSARAPVSPEVCRAPPLLNQVARVQNHQFTTSHTLANNVVMWATWCCSRR